MINDERMKNNEETKNSVPDNTNNGSMRSLTAFIVNFLKALERCTLQLLIVLRLYFNDLFVRKALVNDLNPSGYYSLKECQDE